MHFIFERAGRKVINAFASYMKPRRSSSLSRRKMLYRNVSAESSGVTTPVSSNTTMSRPSSFDFDPGYFDEEVIYGTYASLPRTLSRMLRIHARKLFVAIAAILFVVFTILHLFGITTMLSYKASNWRYDRALQIGCSGPSAIRKTPVVFVVDEETVVVQFETNCELYKAGIEWNKTDGRVINGRESGEWGLVHDILPQKVFDSDRHLLYRVMIGPLTPMAKYKYQIVLGATRTIRGSLLAEGSFSWVGGYRNHAGLTDYPPPSALAEVDEQDLPSDPRPEFSYPIKLALVGDNQFGLAVFQRLISSMAKWKPSYLVHVGDAVQSYTSLRQWQTDFFAPLSHYKLTPSVPLIFARGNHDAPLLWEGIDPKHAYIPVRPWYALTIANTRILVLDSNAYEPEQNQWIRDQLQHPDWQQATFRIIVVHIPPMVEYWDPYAWHDKEEKNWGRWVHDEWMQLWENANADLIISGHQHNYQRSQVGYRDPYNGRKRSTYTIIGGGGGDLDHERVEDHNVYVKTEFRHHWIKLELHQSRLVWTAIDEHGRSFDHFELTRHL